MLYYLKSKHPKCLPLLSIIQLDTFLYLNILNVIDILYLVDILYLISKGKMSFKKILFWVKYISKFFHNNFYFLDCHTNSIMPH